MHAGLLVARLEKFTGVLPAAAGCVSGDDARWKPASGAWSVLEIVSHLVDEEVEDFRARLHSTLRDPKAPWGRNDPEGWATQRRYNERDLGESVGRFVTERRASVAWLRSLRDPDWSAAYQHPQVGPITGAELLASWAAHDALHLRQIAKRLYELAERDGGVSVEYAGEWRA